LLSPNSIKAQYIGTGSNKKTINVKGYFKKDGTYIAPYKRTKTNGYNLDNFKAKGNYNPYTGKIGKKIYKSPYNSYGIKNNSSLFKTYKFNYNTKPIKIKSFKYKKLKF